MVARFILALACVTSACLAEDGFTPLDLRKVRVQGEIGRRIDATVKNNLLVLNADEDFLKPFLERKGISGGYVGLGKLIDSAVLLAAHTGDSNVLARKNHLVDQIIASQEPDGYLGLFPPGQRVAGLWDVHEVQYIIWGLLQDHRYFGSAKSLEAAKKAAGYLIDNWSKIPGDWGQKTGVATHVAVTGLERTMIALHRATGDRKYLDFVIQQRALNQWDLPIVIGRRPGIEGHIYAYLARCLAQLELQDVADAGKGPAVGGRETCTQRALDFMTRGDGLMITGGCGQWEIWTNDQDGRGELGETCATAYQLRIYDAMLRRQGEAGGCWGDLMERTIFNALFAAQSPDGRKLRYFSPTEGPRVYHPTDTYCCPCNYRRIVAELPGFIYYRMADGIAVNLFAPSQGEFADVGGTGVTIRQETEYPSAGKITFRVEPQKEARFALAIRIPRWATAARMALPDGTLESIEPVKRDGFVRVARVWKPGDQLILELPMDFRLVKGRQRQAGRVAVMRGPIVFCLDPAQQKSLEKLDGADLGRIVINPATLHAIPDDTVRPGGVAGKVEAWKATFGLSEKADFELILREFPDPAGRQTYFRLRDESGVDDELLQGR